MKKLITFLLTAALLTPTAVFAEDIEDTANISETASTDVSEDNTDDAFEESHSEYIGVYATVTSVTESDAATLIEGVDEQGEPVEFMLAKGVLIIAEDGDSAELAEGVKICAYTKWDAPMVMKLPPQYRPQVVVIDNSDEIFTDADKYAKTEDVYTNAANTLAIDVAESEIVNADGTEAEEDIDGKNLLVFYGASTRSIPAQTSPSKVVVLAEEVPGDDNTDDKEEEKTNPLADWETVDFDGVAMLPVRAVADSLGYEVSWDNELRAVTVGTVQMGINFKIGENSYNKSKMTPFELESAPVLVETEEGGVTYVPVSFFTEVIGIGAEY